MSEIVTFRVNKKLKERMARLRQINWSELLRSYAEGIVESEENKAQRVRDLGKMDRAIQQMDRLARVSKGSSWSGSEEVIRWRKKRYSYLTQASR